MSLRYFLIFLVLFSSAGCSGDNPKEPENLIPEEKYVSLLVEMQLVRSYGENAETDSTTVDSLTSVIYKKYSITEDQFQKSHNFYQHFPKEQKNRVDRAIEQLKQEIVIKSDSTVKADSIQTPE